jgi:hypothetical protein
MSGEKRLLKVKECTQGYGDVMGCCEGKNCTVKLCKVEQKPEEKQVCDIFGRDRHYEESMKAKNKEFAGFLKTLK